MYVQLVLHPSRLTSCELRNCSVVVFDVIRATTTIVTALANGAAEVRAFMELDDARAAHAAFDGLKLLAGERGCLPPAGFDLGNSPSGFAAHRVGGRTIFLSTTNGTRAVRACEQARHTLVASLCNATATAQRLIELDTDVVLACAGVDGAPGGEDIDGAATVADVMRRRASTVDLSDDLAAAVEERSVLSLPQVEIRRRLHATPGAQNLSKAGLVRDIDACAALDLFQTVATVMHQASYAKIVATEGRRACSGGRDKSL